MDLVQGQPLEPLQELLLGFRPVFLEDLGEADELDEGDRLLRPELLLDLQEADDVADRFLELGVDPDVLVGFGVEPVEREGELVEAGVEKLAGLVFRREACRWCGTG